MVIHNFLLNQESVVIVFVNLYHILISSVTAFASCVCNIDAVFEDQLRALTLLRTF
jgi:hypothetical protein